MSTNTSEGNNKSEDVTTTTTTTSKTTTAAAEAIEEDDEFEEFEPGNWDVHDEDAEDAQQWQVRTDGEIKTM